MRKNTGIVAAFLVMVTLGGCQSNPAPNAVDPEAFSPSEYQDAAWRSIMSSYPDAERPEVSVVRVIGNADFPVLFSDCMREQNFEVVVSEDTSFEVTVPPGQDEAFAMSNYICEATYPRPLILSRPDNEQTGQILYAYYREELVPCLTSLGYSPEPLPSEQAFLQGLNGAQRYDPYSSLIASGGGLTIDDWDSANVKCPQRPSSLGG